MKTIQILTFTFLLFISCTLSAQNINIPRDRNVPQIESNPLFQQLKQNLANNKCYVMRVSSTSLTNRKGDKVTSFSTYGTSILIAKGNKLVSGDISTSISDRNLFQGKKTEEKVIIMDSGRNITVKIMLKTWGNKKLTLRDVKISKETNGYFITGKATGIDGNKRQAYYTIAIFEEDCLH